MGNALEVAVCGFTPKSSLDEILPSRLERGTSQKGTSPSGTIGYPKDIAKLLGSSVIPETVEQLTMAWKKETDELIRKRWVEGLSASQIAAEIGVSRNAIIGRVHRLGLSGRANSGKLGREAGEIRFELEVIELLKEAKFKVLPSGSFRRMMGDFVAEHVLLGRERRYAIEVLTHANVAKIQEYADRVQNYAAQSKQPFADFDEFWVVTDKFAAGSAKGRLVGNRHFRALDVRELKGILAQLTSPANSKSRPKKKARTKIGKAIEENETEIDLAIAGLILQIEDKLAVLRTERPNSDDAITRRDERISDYERMRAELETIRQMMSRFKTGEVKEANVVQSVNTFADGIKSWWNESHATICTRAFDLGLFASSVGICSMAGAGGKIAVVVSAALVGGKSVTGALKGLSKKFLAD